MTRVGPLGIEGHVPGFVKASSDRNPIKLLGSAVSRGNEEDVVRRKAAIHVSPSTRRHFMFVKSSKTIERLLFPEI